MMDYRKTIASLLAKAESTNHPGEAEVFQKKAEALMVKWGISDAMLEARDTSIKPDVIEVRFKPTGIYATAITKIFAPAVVRGMGGMKLLLSHDGKAIYIIGVSSDVNRALELLDSVVTQANTAMRAWWKALDKTYLDKNDGYRERRAFISAFGIEVGRRLTALRDAEVAAAAAEVGSALAVRSGVVDEYFDNKYPRLRTTKTNMRGGYHGAPAGRAAGARAGLGGSKTTAGGRGAIA